MEPGSFDVFLCHSSADRTAVLEMAEALRGRGLNVWLDLWELVPGRPWQEGLEQILKAVGAAAVCFGPSGPGPWQEPEIQALLSEFIRRRLPVIPAILPAVPPGSEPDLPLFLRSFTWVDLRPAITDQGLDRLEWGIRGVKPGTEASEDRRQGKPAVPRHAAPSLSAGLKPAEVFELSVEIERTAGALSVRYVLPGGVMRERPALPWNKVQEDWTALRQRLDEAGERALFRWIEEARHGRDTFLCSLLLGEEKEWGPLLRNLFGAPAPAPPPTPVKHPVRLRVVTSDPDLAGFPWRLTAWEGRRLVNHGWTFEVSRDAAPARTVALPAPSNVLLFDPSGGEVLQAIGEVLSQVWPQAERDYLRPAANPSQLENALAGMRPHLLVLCGEAGALPLTELPGLFRQAGHTPDAVAFATTGLDRIPVELLRSEIPLLVWPRLREQPDLATSWLVPWLRRWLEKGEDPVVALHAVSEEADPGGRLQASTLVLRTAYRSWSTAQPPKSPGLWDPRRELDRVQIKAEVGRRILHLARRDALRALALVGCSAPGHAVASLCKQLRADLERETDPSRLPIAWYEPEFPADRDLARLRANLEAELTAHLEPDDREPLPHLLRRKSPKGVPSGTRKILWLDWGTFGKGAGCRHPLSPEELREWLLFSGEVLARQCPSDLRVVSFLAIESEKLDRLNELLHTLQDEPIFLSMQEFSLIPLEPLKPVSAHDLREFLREPRYGCNPAYQGEIARRVFARTEGKFDPTVELLEKAKQTSWYALLESLRHEQGAAAPVSREEL